MHKKRDKNFASQKRTKTKIRTRFSPKKAKPGAFWVLEGMGTVGNRGERIKPGAKTRKARRKSRDGLISAAASGAAPQWGAPSTDRGGSRDRRGRAPLALAHPSARGFGVDVGIRQREPWRTGFKLSFSQNHKRAVLVWCSQDGARRVPKPRLI